MPLTTRSKTLGHDDLPALFHAADRAALDGQYSFHRTTVGTLILLAVAAFGGAFTWRSDDSPDWAGIVAAIAFILALILRVHLLATHPERQWYQGRAAAESIKTLAWRYAVAARPFEKSATDPNGLFISRLRDLLGELKDIQLPAPEAQEQITHEMRVMRGLSLQERKESYDDGRCRDQLGWYSRRSTEHANRAKVFQAVTLILESTGAIGAVLKAAALVNTDLLGLAATLVAGVIAWQQATQDAALAQAYAVAAHELSAIRTLIKDQMSEQKWADFVDQAEEAISREHTLWRASRA